MINCLDAVCEASNADADLKHKFVKQQHVLVYKTDLAVEFL